MGTRNQEKPDKTNHAQARLLSQHHALLPQARLHAPARPQFHDVAATCVQDLSGVLQRWVRTTPVLMCPVRRLALQERLPAASPTHDDLGRTPNEPRVVAGGADGGLARVHGKLPGEDLLDLPQRGERELVSADLARRLWRVRRV